MKPDWQIELKCHGDKPAKLEDVLNTITERPDSDCEAAWELFDENVPEDMMLTIQKFAGLGWNTKQIFKILEPYFQRRGGFPDTVMEMTILLLERAVRKQKELPL